MNVSSVINVPLHRASSRCWGAENALCWLSREHAGSWRQCPALWEKITAIKGCGCSERRGLLQKKLLIGFNTMSLGLCRAEVFPSLAQESCHLQTEAVVISQDGGAVTPAASAPPPAVAGATVPAGSTLWQCCPCWFQDRSKAMNPWGINCPLQLAPWWPPEALGRGGCPGGMRGISSHGNLPTPSTWAGICPPKGWAPWASKNKTKSGTLTLIETNNVVPKQSRSKPYKNKGWSQDQCLWHSAAFSTEIT